MKRQVQQEFHKLLSQFNDASVKIEALAYDNDLKDIIKIVKKCEEMIERPLKSMINNLGVTKSSKIKME